MSAVLFYVTSVQFVYQRNYELMFLCRGQRSIKDTHHYISQVTNIHQTYQLSDSSSRKSFQQDFPFSKCAACDQSIKRNPTFRLLGQG